MALDKEAIKRLGIQFSFGMQVVDGDDWSDENYIWYDNSLDKVAQAIYALGVKDEREKNANTVEMIANGHELKAMTTTEQDEINELRSVAWKFKSCAEAIRKGE